MELILIQDVPKVGYKGDTVKVRPGYARNYLIPQGLGIIATEGNKKREAENQRQAAHKLEQQKNEALALAEKLGAISLTLNVKTGSNGKIFGNVTTLQIAQALKEQGYEIDRRKISLSAPIKEAGEYAARVDLHREAKAEIKLNVVGEPA